MDTQTTHPEPVSFSDQATDSRFIEVPGLLVVRLMSRCNQNCVFCMVGGELRTVEDIPYEEAAARILAQPAETSIELFGGEPTLYPHFLDLLEVARKSGHACSIATNGRIFASEKYTARVAALDPSQIYIRTSLYGSSPQVHDFYTCSPGSYSQTVRGIQNIVRSGFTSQVNIVIMARNVAHLQAITTQVHSWGVPRIKYGNLMDIDSCAEHAVPVATVRPALAGAIGLAESLGMEVTVEKTPVCVASGRIDLMSTERQIGGWPRAFDDAGPCGSCLVRRWCEGLDPQYAGRIGYEGLECITAVPAKVLKGTVHAGAEPEFLKFHCVEVADGEISEEALVAMSDLLQIVEMKLGQLVVFPHRFIMS